jgi:hypothetical protein
MGYKIPDLKEDIKERVAGVVMSYDYQCIGMLNEGEPELEGQCSDATNLADYLMGVVDEEFERIERK